MIGAHRGFAFAGVTAVALLSAACQSGAGDMSAAAGVTKITSTTSFGMCVGYCTTQLDIADGEAVLTRIGRGGRGAATLPDETLRRSLTSAEWQEFTQLASRARFQGLPEVLGCPDCADGGAETLSIETASGTQSVKFEYGANVEALQPLLDRVRKEREKLMPAEQ